MSKLINNRFVVEKSFSFDYISIVRFPADIDKRLEWVRNVRKKDWNPEERDVLCSKHFNNECFFYGDGGRKYLRRNAVPTNFSKRTMYFSHPESSENPADTANERKNFSLYYELT